MAIEIEHKFLVNSTAYRNLAEPVLYRQGYLAVLPDKVIRVRLAGDKGFITVKARVSDLSRKEFEYPVPREDAEQLLEELCQRPLIEKLRYRIFHEGFYWEVDEFLGDNTGLVVAEIEVLHEAQTFALPGWVGKEVSGDPRYLNSSLARHPFKTWNQ